MKYIPIFCEEQRRREIVPLGQRGGIPLVRENTGRAYAVEHEGRWRCAVCGKPVCVVVG